MTNGAYESRSQSRHWLDREDIVRDDIFLDTPDRRGSDHGFYTISSSEGQYGHYHHHPYRMSEK